MFALFSSLSSVNWLALVGFVVTMSITPGPNNTMLLYSGLRFGFKRSIAHVLGVNLGFSFMLAVTALGLGQIISANPGLQVMMKWLSIVMFGYMAYRMATAPYKNYALDQGQDRERPMGFFGAAAFQWINPKAWLMCVAAGASFIPGSQATQFMMILALAGSFAVLGIACSSTWVLFGHALRTWLSDPTRQRWFNRAAALALMLCVLIL